MNYVDLYQHKQLKMYHDDLDLLEEAVDRGVNVKLKWICNEQNEYEQECAEEFKEDYTFPFEIVLV